MSSFSENFERNDKNTDVIFDTNAFYPVLASGIALAIIVLLFNIVRSFFIKYKYENENEYRNCQCKLCKKKLSMLSSTFKAQHHYSFIYYIIIIVLVVSFFICYNKIQTTQKNVKSFNPYEILDISPEANATAIKKAYKKLALKYHPDKNRNNLQAKAMFILINKAYDALTDEESKKNYELYGNPDGRTSMRVSVGLPSFILDKRYHMKILFVFLIFIVVIIPYNFFKWYKRTQQYDGNGNLLASGKMFVSVTTPQSNITMIPLYLGLAAEFAVDKIEDKTEIKNIDELFQSALTTLPQIDYSKLSAGNKKGIAIAEMIARANTEFKTKIKYSDDYIKTLAKLIDCLFLSQYEKYTLFAFMMNNPHNDIGLRLPPITKEFLFDILKYQQCFFQGVSLKNANKDFAAFLQLPHITKVMINSVFIKEKIIFKDFLKSDDESKKKLLKEKCGITSEEEITDIIEAAKSIPIYEFKVKAYVEGFCDFVCGDLVTYHITIKRNNVGHKKLGIGHTMMYPGNINECVQICVINGDKMIHQHKVKITSKMTTYDFNLKLSNEGTVPMRFEMKSTCYLGVDGSVDVDVKVVKNSESRNEMIKSIEKRKVKVELSYFAKMLQEAGMMMAEDDDEEEEEEEEEQTHTEETKEEEKKNINIEGNKTMI